MGTPPLCQGRRSQCSAKPLTDCILCDRRWPISRDGEWLYPLPELVDGRCPMRVAYAVMPPGLDLSEQAPPSGSALPVLPPAPSGAGGVLLFR